MRWVRKPPICSTLISPSDTPAVAAAYFDGKSARPHPVTLALDGDMLVTSGESISRRDSLATLRVSEPMGAAPRLISYPDGGHCEVRDHQGLRVLLATSGHCDSVVVRLQDHWRAAVAAVLVTVATLAAGYVWGLPALSESIAMRTPERVVAQLGKSTLDVLDRAALGPSELPEHRQQQLREAFARLVTSAGDIKPSYRILFRKGQGVGANALALPDGTIVMTDELVKLAADDEEILAVLAHELGHINRRHSLRMLIQGSIVAFVVSWYIGDVSSVAAGLPTLLLQASYSREHEAESDRYAAAMLRANGISPKRLGEMLQKLERAHRKSGDGRHESAETGSSRSGAFNDYFATHPGTAERIRALGSL
jgi:Zn-dependent protease with chaperone function